jgi:hypothetical protein
MRFTSVCGAYRFYWAEVRLASVLQSRPERSTALSVATLRDLLVRPNGSRASLARAILADPAVVAKSSGQDREDALKTLQGDNGPKFRRLCGTCQKAAAELLRQSSDNDLRAFVRTFGGQEAVEGLLARYVDPALKSELRRGLRLVSPAVSTGPTRASSGPSANLGG